MIDLKDFQGFPRISNERQDDFRDFDVLSAPRRPKAGSNLEENSK
jgi:hypothetical protein